jgi:hypothetical protein
MGSEANWLKKYPKKRPGAASWSLVYATPASPGPGGAQQKRLKTRGCPSEELARGSQSGRRGRREGGTHERGGMERCHGEHQWVVQEVRRSPCRIIRGILVRQAGTEKTAWGWSTQCGKGAHKAKAGKGMFCWQMQGLRGRRGTPAARGGSHGKLRGGLEHLSPSFRASLSPRNRPLISAFARLARDLQ